MFRVRYIIAIIETKYSFLIACIYCNAVCWILVADAHQSKHKRFHAWVGLSSLCDFRLSGILYCVCTKEIYFRPSRYELGRIETMQVLFDPRSIKRLKNVEFNCSIHVALSTVILFKFMPIIRMFYWRKRITLLLNFI